MLSIENCAYLILNFKMRQLNQQRQPQEHHLEKPTAATLVANTHQLCTTTLTVNSRSHVMIRSHLPKWQPNAPTQPTPPTPSLQPTQPTVHRFHPHRPRATMEPTCPCGNKKSATSAVAKDYTAPLLGVGPRGTLTQSARRRDGRLRRLSRVGATGRRMIRREKSQRG